MGVFLEGQGEQLGVELAVGVGEDEKAAGELARGEFEVLGAGGRAAAAELDERADDGGDEQPLALRDRPRVGSQRRGGGRGRDQDAVLHGDRHLDGQVEPGPRLGELRPAGAQGFRQHLFQARGGGRGRVGPATGVEFALEGGHLSTVPTWPTREAELSLMGRCRESSSATRPAARRRASVWPGGRPTRPTARC